MKERGVVVDWETRSPMREAARIGRGCMPLNVEREREWWYEANWQRWRWWRLGVEIERVSDGLIAEGQVIVVDCLAMAMLELSCLPQKVERQPSPIESTAGGETDRRTSIGVVDDVEANFPVYSAARPCSLANHGASFYDTCRRGCCRDIREKRGL